MTHTTPEHARKIARELDDQNAALDRSSRIALRSLADQLDAVTEKRDFAVESAKYTADLCAQAIAELTAVTAERDALTKDATRYRWWARVVTEKCRTEVEEAFGSLSRQLTPPTAEQFASCIDAAIAKEAK